MVVGAIVNSRLHSVVDIFVIKRWLFGCDFIDRGLPVNGLMQLIGCVNMVGTGFFGWQFSKRVGWMIHILRSRVPMMMIKIMLILVEFLLVRKQLIMASIHIVFVKGIRVAILPITFQLALFLPHHIVDFIARLSFSLITLNTCILILLVVTIAW